MEWSGVLNWRDYEGLTGTLGRFSKIEAPDQATAERIVLDDLWDPRLDSAGCSPVVVFNDPGDID